MLSFSNYTYYALQTHAYAFENVPLVARTIAVRTYINLKGEKKRIFFNFRIQPKL